MLRDWRSDLKFAGCALLLLAAAVACRWDFLTSPFLPISDLPHALGNWAVRSWKNLPYLFSPSYADVFWEGSYHPLYTFVTFVNYAACGLDPMGFRIFRVAVVWFNALLVARLFRRQLGPWAWAAALFYACHPCHGEAGMLPVKDELVTLFCLLGLGAHHDGGRRGYPVSRALLVGLCNALALASKETGIVFPALLLSMDIGQGVVPKDPGARRRWARPYLACAAVTMLYVLFRFKVIIAGGNSALGYSGDEQLLGILARLQGYVEGLTASPWQSLAAWRLILAAAIVGGAFRFADKEGRGFAAGCLAWMGLGMLPTSGILPVEGLSHYLATQAAGPGFRPCGRYLVLPAVGYAWLLGLGLRISLGNRRWLRGTVFLVQLAVVADLTAKGYRPHHGGDLPVCSDDQKDRSCVDSYTTVLMSLPFMKNHYPQDYLSYHGSIQRSLGQLASPAEDYFGTLLEHPCRTAQFLRRNPASLQDMWRGMRADKVAQESGELLSRGRPREALKKLQELARLDPGLVARHLQAAMALGRLGDSPQAAREYEEFRASADRPELRGRSCPEEPPDGLLASLGAQSPAGMNASSGHSHWRARLPQPLRPFVGPQTSRPLPRQTRAGRWISMAEADIEMGQRQSAKEHLRQALPERPDDEDRKRIAIAYQRLGSYRMALSILDRLLREHPERAARLNDRGVALAMAGRPREAMADFEAAIARDGNAWSAYFSLAELYAAAGRRTEALRVCEQALSLMGGRPAGDWSGRISIECSNLRTNSPETKQVMGPP